MLWTSIALVVVSKMHRRSNRSGAMFFRTFRRRLDKSCHCRECFLCSKPVCELKANMYSTSAVPAVLSVRKG